MRADPLAALLRVRRLTLDEARRGLADCLRAEAEAALALTQAETEIVLERATAARLDADDAAVEAFAAWLRVARGVSERALAAHARASAETARARAIVAVARGSFEAAQTALDRNAENERRLGERRDQLSLDEAAQARHRAAAIPHRRGNGDTPGADVLNTRNIRGAPEPCGSH